MTLFPQAFAQSLDEAVAPAPRAAPQPPPSSSTPPILPHAQSQEISSPNSATFTLYGSAFIVMVIGMIAKVVFDILRSNAKSTWHLKEFLLPMIMSPLVYMGLFQIVNVQATQTGYIGLCFWPFKTVFSGKAP